MSQKGRIGREPRESSAQGTFAFLGTKSVLKLSKVLLLFCGVLGVACARRTRTFFINVEVRTVMWAAYELKLCLERKSTAVLGE